MRFYQQQHQYYCGVELHVRSMYMHILDADKRTVLDEDLPAEPGAFLEAVAPYRQGLVIGAPETSPCRTPSLDFGFRISD
jgi:hypothetical protein